MDDGPVDSVLFNSDVVTTTVPLRAFNACGSREEERKQTRPKEAL
jgi:hypothetical protein